MRWKKGENEKQDRSYFEAEAHWGETSLKSKLVQDLCEKSEIHKTLQNKS